ncbi:hypothetical protein HOLleu_17944 [Holothuria leucospilota]|uniref:Uncharacterized protein n=1 Tax=Holothuria leucospilota TaxID=206669 RepID=A0A9Q1C392_HOLLE|nr:hypothetical protein HOLleu_17944 [Holothuria leucospilota]
MIYNRLITLKIMADRSLDDIIKERNFSGVGRRGRQRTEQCCKRWRRSERQV